MNSPSVLPEPTVLTVGQWLEPYVSRLVGLVGHRANVEFLADDSVDSLVSRIGGADVVITTWMDAPVAAAANRLRLLQVPGSGVDRIDLDALPDRVVVANCYEHEYGIAEYIMMQALALTRGLVGMDSALRSGDWCHSAASGDPPRPELRGRTLGLLGLGHIGRATAVLAKAFQMRTVAMTRSVPPESMWPDLAVDHVVPPDGLLDVLSAADVVAVALPLDPSTRSTIGERELASMRRTAYLVNPARGAVVDEAALYDALSRGVIAGAAIDTWYRYPARDGERITPSRLPFERLTNVIMTPHIAGYTAQTMDRRMDVIGRNIVAMLDGRPIENVVRPGGGPNAPWSA